MTSIVAAAIATGLALGIANPTRASEDQASWYERIDFGGDFRARSEEFIVSGRRDRHRLRYRLRLGATTELNDYFDAGFRLATGSGANTSNQTLGSGDDFDPDGVFIDRAYLTFQPHGSEKPIFGDSLALTFGKMSNPFKPKGLGPALLMWDVDQMPEGVALGWSATPADRWTTNLDVGYFVIDENAFKRDPIILGVQLENDLKAHKQLHLKTQLSYYALRKLNDDFFERSLGEAGENFGFGGNTSGLSKNNEIDLIEFHGAMTWTGCENWPLTVWGNLIYNASAVGIGQGKQNLGFGAGFEVGSKTATVRLGLCYFEIEADAVPSMLGDSSLFDGITNGKGFQAFVIRQIWKNIDFDLHTYFGKVLNRDLRGHQSVTPIKRIRIQTNIIARF